jgi:type I restriction enzyme S subunit
VSSLKSRDICLVPLKDLGTWCGGGTPSKRELAYWENGTIPWVSPKDMKVEYITGAEDSITEKAVQESTTNLLPAGAVLAVTRSGILRHTFPVAVTDVPVTINQDLKALVPKPEINSKYVAFALRAFSRDILNQCSKQGTTVNSIETKELLKFQIPLFSLGIQTRIVAEIEKQFSRLDEAVANLKRVKANLKRYKAAVLKAAGEGKLTEEWRRRGGIYPAQSEGRGDQGAINKGAINRAPTETGAELLERILEERRANWQGRGKYKEPVAPDTSGLPELPEGWVWASLPQIGELSRGKSKHRPRDDARLFGGPYPFIQTGEVRKSEGTIRGYSQTYSEFGLQQSRLWPAGTLCITIAANIAETGILTFPASFPDSVVGFLNESLPVTTRYIEFFIRTAKENLERFAPATAQKNINLEVLQNVAVPLPPLAEQHQIVAEVERRLSIIADAEAQVDANLRRADRLRQSILKQAFSGQLVPQDPNDEPAGVLLERIRANVNVGARFIAPKTRPEKPKRAQSIAPLRQQQPTDPVGGIHELPLHAPPTNSDFESLDTVVAAILDHMQPGREYSRADLADALGLSTGRWNAAIQELKRRGKVRQMGERRGARYSLV